MTRASDDRRPGGRLRWLLAMLGAVLLSAAVAATPAGAQTEGSGLLYGIFPGLYAVDPPPALPESNLARVDELAGDRPFLVHLYFSWKDQDRLPAIDRQLEQVAAHGKQAELVLRYYPPDGRDGDVRGYADWVASMVRHFAGQRALTRIQVTNEANGPHQASSDGGSSNALGALVAGIAAAAAERDRTQAQIKLGFNWFYRFGPVADNKFWSDLGQQGGAAFAREVDYVGVDIYPGTYYPAGSPSTDATTRPGLSARDEVRAALHDVRENLLPLAGLGRDVALGIAEIGWPTQKPLRSEAEQAALLREFMAGACDAAAPDNVQYVEWFSLSDRPDQGYALSEGSPANEFGLLRFDGSAKPAFDAYRSVIKTGCAVASRPNASTPSPCTDTGRPMSRIRDLAALRGRRLRASGTAAGRGCGVARVDVNVSRRSGQRCRFLQPSGRLGRLTSCRRPRYLPAHGTTTWRFSAPRPLPPGRYVVRTRARSRAGAYELSTRAGRRATHHQRVVLIGSPRAE